MEENLFQHFLKICSLYKKKLFYSFCLMLAANIFLYINPMMLRYWLNAGESNQLSPWALFGMIIFVSLCSSFLRYFMRVQFNKIGREAEWTMRSSFFKKIQSQSQEFFDRHGVGELVQRLSFDINAYRDAIGPGLMFPIVFSTVLIPGLLALFYISPFMAILTLIPLVIVPLINMSVRKHIYKASQKTQSKLAEMSNFVQEDYSGILMVKSYVAEENMYKRFSLLCREFFGLNFRLMCYQGWFFPFLVAFTRLTTLILVFVAGLLVLPPADFISFMWIQSYLFFPLIILGWVIPLWHQGSSAYSRIKEIYEEPLRVIGSSDNQRIPPQANIRVEHLNFSYPGHDQNLPPILQDINLNIPGGSLVAISGSPGSGKSTLLKLLCREYEIPHGMIFIDEKDIHDYPLSSFWEEIVSVEQVPFLFSKTIRENVGFGKEIFTDAEVWEASELAALHETIIGFEKGYETMVGERGVTLSGGQKSRVAMARAFLVNHSILLLDDVFSAVDNNVANKIFDSLLKIRAGRTIIICTSKINLLEKMDKVYFLVKGKVVEEGSPQELGQIQGRFQALKQLEDIIEPS